MLRLLEQRFDANPLLNCCSLVKFVLRVVPWVFGVVLRLKFLTLFLSVVPIQSTSFHNNEENRLAHLLIH